MKEKNITLVSGLWDLNREGRDFKEHYIVKFKEFLKLPYNMILFLPEELHDIVWEIRKPINTYIRKYELEDIKNIYSPHWDKTQEIRTNPNWYNITGEDGWLKGSPQSQLEYYNPIVQSKMFLLHDASIWNNFNTEFFYWLDAGISNTVNINDLIKDNILEKLPKFSNPFLFLSYEYENYEVHGFKTVDIKKYINKESKYVCRGGLFGGHKEQIHESNATYYSLLSETLNSGYMGTEETLFTIMSYREPNIYKRFNIKTGAIQNFINALHEDKVKIEEIPESLQQHKKINQYEVDNTKINLYILTFNFPEQLEHTLNSMKKVPPLMEKPHIVLLDNSDNSTSIEKNKEICEEYNIEYVSLGGNTGINRGRMSAAEHFDKSDADFMLFFEDDMTLNSSEVSNQVCRNGFKKFVPNLYQKIIKIMLKEKYDFLKLSFTEVYLDNNVQTSWYNVPQHIRSRDWPDYDQLPIHGLDPNSPLTNFTHIKNLEGLSYIEGEIYYANWPMIVSKEGNKKMFIDTKWEHPYEQTWMSYMYQKVKEGVLKPAVLLASPIWHERIKHYKPEERREN